jgi:uncharacterized protein YkwD
MRPLIYGALGLFLAAFVIFQLYVRTSEDPLPPVPEPLAKKEPWERFSVEPGQDKLSAQAILRLTNDTRLSHGLPPLRESRLLNAIAEERVKDMLTKQYVAHSSPSGESYADVAQRAGYRYRLLAENIASGIFSNNQKVVEAWMQSPGHRKNILHPEVEEIGVAVARGSIDGAPTWIAVQIFGAEASPGHAGKEPAGECVPPGQLLQNSLEKLTREIEEQEAELASLGRDLEWEMYLLNRGGERNPDRERDYNEKAKAYNRQVVDAQEKRVALKKLVTDYNGAVAAYNTCLKGNQER